MSTAYKKIKHTKLNAVPFDMRTRMHAALAVVLGQLSGSEDAIYESLCSGRPIALQETVRAMGQKSFLIPFRAHLDGSVAVSSFLQSVQTTIHDGMPYGAVAVKDLRRISSELNAACGFKTLLAVRDMPPRDTLSNSLDLELAHENSGEDLLLDQYRINIIARPEKNHWAVCVRYDEACIAVSEMRTFLDHFTPLLA
jgi:hypothetical protein